MHWCLTAFVPPKEKYPIFTFKSFGDKFQNILRQNGLSQRTEIFHCLFHENISLVELLCLSVENTHGFEWAWWASFSQPPILLPILISDSFPCFLSSVILDKLPPSFLFSQVSHLKMGIISHRNVSIKQEQKYIVLNFCIFFSPISIQFYIMTESSTKVQILIPITLYEGDSSFLSGTPRNISFTEPQEINEIGTLTYFPPWHLLNFSRIICKPKETATDLCLYLKFIVKDLEGQWSIIFPLFIFG